MGYCSTSSSAPPLQVLPRAGVKPMQCSRMHWQIQRLSGRLTLAVVDLVRCGSDAARVSSEPILKPRLELPVNNRPEHPTLWFT